jgi:hypothetical protein
MVKTEHNLLLGSDCEMNVSAAIRNHAHRSWLGGEIAKETTVQRSCVSEFTAHLQTSPSVAWVISL